MLPRPVEGGGEGGAATGPGSGPFISSKPPRVHRRCWDVLICFQRRHWGARNLLVRPEKDSGVWVTGGCLESWLARFQISLVVSVRRFTRSENANVRSDPSSEDRGLFSQTGKPQREIFQIKPKERSHGMTTRISKYENAIKTRGSQRGRGGVREEEWRDDRKRTRPTERSHSNSHH